MSQIFIRNVTFATEKEVIESGDIFIKNGKIIAAAPHLDAIQSGAILIEGRGRVAVPGGVDPHVHFSLPLVSGAQSRDNFKTGSRACLMGGTTSFVDFVHAEPRDRSLSGALSTRLLEAESSFCDFGLHVAVSDWSDTTADEMAECVDRGVKSFKVYLAYLSTVGVRDDLFLKILSQAAKLGARVMVHAENGDAVQFLQKKFLREGKTAPKFHAQSRPADIEVSAVQRAISLAAITGCPIYFAHISAKESLEAIRAAQKRGQDVKGEACLHHLFLTDEKLENPHFDEAAQFVMSPPLRKKEDVNALWEGLSDGTLSAVATDHCPFNVEDRRRGKEDFTRIPNGVAGVSHRMEMLFSEGVMKKRISLPRFVALTSLNAAKLFGLKGKGSFQSGSDADVVLLNPKKKKTLSVENHCHNTDSCVYEGMQIKGAVESVVQKGDVVFEKDRFSAPTESGKFLQNGVQA